MVFASTHETLTIVLLPHLLAAISQKFVQLSGKIKCDQERTVYNHLKKKMAQGLPLTFLLLFLVNWEEKDSKDLGRRN